MVGISLIQKRRDSTFPLSFTLMNIFILIIILVIYVVITVILIIIFVILVEFINIYVVIIVVVLPLDLGIAGVGQGPKGCTDVNCLQSRGLNVYHIQIKVCRCLDNILHYCNLQVFMYCNILHYYNILLYYWNIQVLQYFHVYMLKRCNVVFLMFFACVMCSNISK